MLTVKQMQGNQGVLHTSLQLSHQGSGSHSNDHHHEQDYC